MRVVVDGARVSHGEGAKQDCQTRSGLSD